MIFLNWSRYGVHVSDGRFYSKANGSHGWFHIVLNFIGPSDGIQIYNDGVKVTNDASKRPKNYTDGDKNIVIGRRFSDLDTRYASVQVDELLFFNQTLIETEITMLSKCRSVSNILFYYVLSKIYTARNNSYGKVMFSQGGGVHHKQTSPGRHLPLGRHPRGQSSSGQTPSGQTLHPQTATVADNTHLTWMHSCFYWNRNFSNDVKDRSYGST